MWFQTELTGSWSVMINKALQYQQVSSWFLHQPGGLLRLKHWNSYFAKFACLDFCIFNGPRKNSNSTQFIQGSRAGKTFTACFMGQAAEFKFESRFWPLSVTWQSLLKAIPEYNQRLGLQNHFSWKQFWLFGHRNNNLGLEGVKKLIEHLPLIPSLQTLDIGWGLCSYYWVCYAKKG